MNGDQNESENENENDNEKTLCLITRREKKAEHTHQSIHPSSNPASRKIPCSFFPISAPAGRVGVQVQKGQWKGTGEGILMMIGRYWVYKTKSAIIPGPRRYGYG